MKKNILIICFLFLVSCFFPGIIHADLPPVSSLFSNTAINRVSQFASLTDIINKLVPYILTGAGLILFGMLIAGGFDILMAATDAKKVEAGQARITAALTGFIIIFAAYWIVQILEIMLGVKILNN